jgi:hypothetical protein
MRAAAASLICSIVSLVPMLLHHRDRVLHSWIWCRTGFLTSILATVYAVARRLLSRPPFAERPLQKLDRQPYDGPGAFRIGVSQSGHHKQSRDTFGREARGLLGHWYEFERTATGRGDDRRISYAEAV